MTHQPTEPDSLPNVAERSAQDAMPMLPGLCDISPEQEAGIRATRDTLGDYSGARIAERMPRLYELVSAMVAEGLSDMMIARVSGLSRPTISSIRRREIDALPTRAYMTAQARNLRLAATLATDELRERLTDPDRAREMSPRDLAYAIQVLQSHAQLLAGQPTEVRAELRAEGSDSGLRALLSGRCIELPAAMDSRGNCEASREAGADGSREGAAVAPGTDRDDSCDLAEMGESDAQSPANEG